jgi:hypothetical protein
LKQRNRLGQELVETVHPCETNVEIIKPLDYAKGKKRVFTANHSNFSSLSFFPLNFVATSTEFISNPSDVNCVRSLKVSHDGRYFATGDKQGNIK